MNLFKILASGDGSINEPNVSAFLGYLLNPNADHGIRDEFLRKVMGYLYKTNQETARNYMVDKKSRIRDLSANSKFEVKVLLEQAFKSKDTEAKQIVDIIILCYEKTYNQNESLAKLEVANNNRGELRQIFLIENKIKGSSSRENQLIDQYTSTRDTLILLLDKSEDEIEKLISIIFVSPGGSQAQQQYSKLETDSLKNIPTCHLLWSDESNEDTIVAFLKEILQKESSGEIDPINDITKHIIKSFVTFIICGFKSSIEEELDGKIIRDIFLNFPEFKESYPDLFKPLQWDLMESFQDIILKKYNDISVRHSRSQPVSVFLKQNGKSKKIFDFSRRGEGLKIQLVTYNHELLKSREVELLQSLSDWGYKNTKVKDFGIELNFDSITCEEALKILDKLYQLLI